MKPHERIEAKRIKIGISVAEVTRRIDEKPATVSAWFKGTHTPKFEQMLKLADLLEMSLDEIAGRVVTVPGLNEAEALAVEMIRELGLSRGAVMRLLRAPDPGLPGAGSVPASPAAPPGMPPGSVFNPAARETAPNVKGPGKGKRRA